MRSSFPSVCVLAVVAAAGFAPSNPPVQGATDLPKWFDGNRVQAHTRLTLRMLGRNDAIFFHAAEAFDKMDANVYTRHIKAGGEGAWWPTAVGEVVPQAKGRNIAKEILDDAHSHGNKLIAYHRLMEDNWAAKEHPDWVCETPDGQPFKANRGSYMCLNSPYTDYFLTRGSELVKLGADGFYFDEHHMPPSGCFNKYCRDAFRRETGKDAPVGKKITDPLYQEYIDFQNRSIQRAFDKWEAAWKKINPAFVMVVSASRWNSFGDRHLNEAMLRKVDSIKTEFNIGLREGNNKVFKNARNEMAAPREDSRFLLSWIVARDVAEGRPPHVWVPGLKDEKTSLAATGNLLALGCIANLDVQENEIPNMKLKSSFDLGRKASPFLEGSRPNRWFGIYYSESARNRYSTNDRKAWQEVIYPVAGAFDMAYDSRIPAAIVFDDDLRRNRMNGVRVLFVPGLQNLTAESRTAIDRFKASGGKVIEQRPDWAWWNENQRSKARADLLRTIRGNETPPFVVEGDGELVTGFLTKGTQNIVALSSSSRWFAQGKAAPAADSIITGITLRLRNKPNSVRDLLNDRDLTVTKDGTTWTVAIPKVGNLMLISVE